MEAFLGFISGTYKFVELSQSFGTMSKQASSTVRGKIERKCNLFWSEFHGDRMMTLRLSIDHEQWVMPGSINPDTLNVDAARINIPADLTAETPARYEEIVSGGCCDPFLQFVDSELGAPTVATAEVEQGRMGAYTQSSVKLIRLIATYIHISNILDSMSNQVVAGIIDMVNLYIHSVYKVCGTTLTAPSSFLERALRKSEDDRKGGMRALKSKRAAGQQGKLASALPEHSPTGPAQLYSDIREFPNLPPGVLMMVDRLCESFDTEAEESLHMLPWGERFEGLMWEVPSLFSFVRRSLAIESIMALCEFLNSNRCRLRIGTGGRDGTEQGEPDIAKQIERFFTGTVSEVKNLRGALYEFVACLMFDMDTYVRRLEKTNWELKELGSDNSAYMTEIVRTLRYLSQQLVDMRTPSETQGAEMRLSAEQGAVVVTPEVMDLLWIGLIHKLMHRLVDGVCRISRFTEAGLALMNLDLQVLDQELCQLTSVRPIPEVAFATTFVKAYYLQDEESALQFIKEHTVRAVPVVCVRSSLSVTMSRACVSGIFGCAL